MEDITIDVGVHTTFDIDMTNYPIEEGEKFIFTIKNHPRYQEEAIVTRDMTQAKVHHITVTPEESIKISDGAMYDILKSDTSGKAFKITENFNVLLRRGIGSQVN